MPRKRNVYILTEGHEIQEKETYSNLKKIVEGPGKELHFPSYAAMAKKLTAAKKKDGVLRFESLDGKEYTIEVKEVK